MRLIAFVLLLASLCSPAAAQHWARTWAAAPHEYEQDRPTPPAPDSTVRQIVRLSAGGDRLRIRLSNELSATPLRLGAVRVALAADDGTPVPGSERQVTFAGDRAAVIPAESPLVSDPIELKVGPRARLIVSLHLPDGAATPTMHSLGGATSWIAPGDQTAAAKLDKPRNISQRLILSAVDVENRKAIGVIATLGDSITDGARGTNDADTRWPDLLAARLQAAGMRDLAVANLGISGNRVLRHGTGPSALARFDRDVLSIPGLRQIIVLEGVNDVGKAFRDRDPVQPTADDIIDGFRQLIARAHAHGVKIHFATILPYKGAGYWSEGGEVVRQQVNTWIRSNREADGYFDFDLATRDPADPASMADRFDGGDNLHPNDEGFRAMAGAVDLKRLR
jgi:lysophospholipase L1-like esterase